MTKWQLFWAIWIVLNVLVRFAVRQQYGEVGPLGQIVLMTAITLTAMVLALGVAALRKED